MLPAIRKIAHPLTAERRPLAATALLQRACGKGENRKASPEIKERRRAFRVMLHGEGAGELPSDLILSV